MKFDQKYSYEGFSVFLRDFLPEDYIESEKDIVDLSRCKIITRARELGHSPSLDVYVLEMNHAKEADPRVAIATDAFKILATFGYDKALVIFKNDESSNYRFSYLTISLDLNEKNKVVAKYSNARRYSFYLGEGAKTKTPEQQLVKRGRVKDAADLLSRFSLEVVNKQFYLEIAKFFDELVDEKIQNLTLPSQPDATVRKNFAMRLIGRLMFCWFLKQKKSKDGQLVPDELLSAVAAKDGYYHRVLEPLFFEILNTQIDDRDIRSDAYDKVPYLNGGLFSPQYDDYYDLDRATFTSRHINTLRVSDAWFKAFFELLETYNFTIDENTVFDQELSVDPEMLGRIFENLLAEINPETGSSERKRTGSYYTPRQVVEYMVDQSLIEYLVTATSIDKERVAAVVSYDLSDDSEHPLTAEESVKLVEAIEALKIFDPACGSGAFPIGALQKIVWILQRIDPDCKLWLGRKLAGVPELYRQRIINEVETNPFDYTRKLDVIKNSIFGADIQPIAVEMSRLRCFLTLVVESEINDAKKNRGIEPLPNLDFKFVCANTLVGLPRRESNGLFEDHSGIEALSTIMSEYFSSSNQRKAEIRQRFTNTQKDILNRSLSTFGRTTGELTLKLSLWDPFSNIVSPWFDPEWMFGLDHKFNIVIGNPPYLESRHPSFSTESKEALQDATESRWAEDSQYVTKGADLLIYFYERGISLIENDGLLVYIVQNSWLDTDYGKKFQQFLLKHTNVKSVVDSDLKHFDGPNINTVITVFSGKTPREDNEVVLSRFGTTYSELHRLSYANPLLKEIKWGVLLVASEEVLNLFEIIRQRGKLIESTGLTVGQGLNLSKSAVVDADIISKFPYLNGNLLPFMNTADGAPFELTETKNYLVNATGLNADQISELEAAGIEPFNPRSTSKVPPMLILPRGVSRHFCALNPVGAYTGSAVEIYDRNASEDMKMNLWCFLNSSIAWLLREVTGRKNLGGGLLKAEATDLKSIPVYFDFGVPERIKEVYEKIRTRQAKSTLEEIDTDEHKAIDDIVFGYLGIPEEKRESLVAELKHVISRRSEKAKT